MNFCFYCPEDEVQKKEKIRSGQKGSIPVFVIEVQCNTWVLLVRQQTLANRKFCNVARQPRGFQADVLSKIILYHNDTSQCIHKVKINIVTPYDLELKKYSCLFWTNYWHLCMCCGYALQYKTFQHELNEYVFILKKACGPRLAFWWILKFKPMSPEIWTASVIYSCDILILRVM